MRIRNFLFSLTFTIISPGLVYGNTDECALNSNGEIINNAECETDAIALQYIVEDIHFCTTLPTSTTEFKSCESWNVSPFQFIITRDSVTNVSVNREIPAGTYRWLALTKDTIRQVRARATFDRVMTGSSGEGKKCWTNGVTINRGSDPDIQPDQQKWSADCGDNFPATIPNNTIIYNDFSAGPDDFESVSENDLPDGSRTVGYLVNDRGNLSSSRSDVSNVITLIRLKTPIVVSGDPEKVGVFNITYDRSRGAEFLIDSDTVPRINHGTFTVDVDYREANIDQ